MLELIEIKTEIDYKLFLNKINSKFPSETLSIAIQTLERLHQGCQCNFKRRLIHTNEILKNYINSINDETHSFLKEQYQTKKITFVDLT